MLYNEIMENLLKKGGRLGSGAGSVGDGQSCVNFLFDGNLCDFVAIYRSVPIKMVPAFADCGMACLTCTYMG